MLRQQKYMATLWKFCGLAFSDSEWMFFLRQRMVFFPTANDFFSQRMERMERMLRLAVSSYIICEVIICPDAQHSFHSFHSL